MAGPLNAPRAHSGFATGIDACGHVADHEGIYNERGAPPKTPLIRRFCCLVLPRPSGERWLAVPDQHVLMIVRL